MRRAPFGILAALFAAPMLLAAAGPGAAQGILNTKHNLAAGVGTTPQGDIKTTGTTEVCVFCHTPHAANPSVSAPLWNRRVGDVNSYTMYSSSSLDATPDKNNMGVSLACLSCHDGTIAFDALRNLPGPGGYSSDPSADGVTNWTFTNATNKKMPGDRITNIGTDLSNDHPIAMQYSAARSPSATSADETAGFQNATTGNNGRTWVENSALGTRVPLYDTDGRVQCATCHDPHRSDTQTFLRVANDQSKLCRTCHKKDG